MSSIMQYNGAAVIAMAGKDCIAIASDRRYGIRNQTVGCEMQKVFQMSDKVMVGLTGLASDQQTLLQKFRFRSNMYRLREERDIGCRAFSNMVSSLLYEKRCADPRLPTRPAQTPRQQSHFERAPSPCTPDSRRAPHALRPMRRATQRSPVQALPASPPTPHPPPRILAAGSHRSSASPSSPASTRTTSPSSRGWTCSARR